jgi:hypothetical protein
MIEPLSGIHRFTSHYRDLHKKMQTDVPGSMHCASPV